MSFCRHRNRSVRYTARDFCKRISALSADVFIIMARKASCFFDCLEELGLIHFDGLVTSERILDMDTDWLKDKDVSPETINFFHEIKYLF